jgi:hypothetical protein
MSKTIVGVFDNYNYAETAARQVKDRGLRTDDISIIAKQQDNSKKDTVKNGHKPMVKRDIFAFTRIHQTLFNPY